MKNISLTAVPFSTIRINDQFIQAQNAWLESCDCMPIINTGSPLINDDHIAAYQKISTIYKQSLRNGQILTNVQFYDFLDRHFNLFQVTTVDQDQGLMTGYFQPDLAVHDSKTAHFKYPIHARPNDLIVIEDAGLLNPSVAGHRIAGKLMDGTVVPYDTHDEILRGGLGSRAKIIAWCDNYVDLFFAHIQGSARLIDQDGRQLHICYDGTNGHRYTTIGRYMIDQGFIDKADVSMRSIKQWLIHNPQRQHKVLTQNKSYIFFKSSPLPHGPSGALGTVLTPQATIAIDPRFVPLGCIMWLDFDYSSSINNVNNRLQRLVMAQDIGGVIKGPLRADFFWGSGVQAGEMAGVMKSQTKFYVLLPKNY